LAPFISYQIFYTNNMHTYYWDYIISLLDIICKFSIINLGSLIQFFRGARLYTR